MNGSSATAHAVAAMSGAVALRLLIEAEAIEDSSGTFGTGKAEHNHAVFPSSCAQNCRMLAIAAAESASRRGASDQRRLANAHGVFARCWASKSARRVLMRAREAEARE